MANNGYNATHHHYKAPSYSVDVYISYMRSICNAVEQRVKDCPPRRPQDFWRLVDKEKDNAKWRMRRISGEYQNLAKAKSDQQQSTRL